ncbi:hypothetical protein Nepgr_001284 [Nepenthes gracilis]|uniref:Uncharacterized protein n=1 Tax=Nepenthes gracilis TaxID=150966 RepID=A0AAD3P2I4_NEPGR|nr:hypothetical protein Nepgr_001284 [Nepenthes gracilis]
MEIVKASFLVQAAIDTRRSSRWVRLVLPLEQWPSQQQGLKAQPASITAVNSRPFCGDEIMLSTMSEEEKLVTLEKEAAFCCSYFS